MRLKGIPLSGAIGLALSLVYVFTVSTRTPGVLHTDIDIGHGDLTWLTLRDRGAQHTEM